MYVVIIANINIELYESFSAAGSWIVIFLGWNQNAEWENMIKL